MRVIEWAEFRRGTRAGLALSVSFGLSLMAGACSEPECPRDQIKIGMRCEGGHREEDGGLDLPTTAEQRGDAAARLDSGSTPSSDGAVEHRGESDAQSAPAHAHDASSPPSCTPSGEECDRRDNDCDGEVDEGVTNACGGCDSIAPGAAPNMPCSSGAKGVCSKPGTWNCFQGTTVCSAPEMPSEEICDGKDNDCDGVTDNGVEKNSCGGCGALPHEKGDACDNGLLGECRRNGAYRCNADSESVTCTATTVAGAPESCDGKDNDCNGQVDDNAVDAVTWYKDCDGDGYAGSKTGSISTCQKPSPQGSCLSWTDVEPTALTNTDCNTENALYRPGAGFGVPSGNSQSGDLNCDQKPEPLATLTSEDGTELALCTVPSSCDCFIPMFRNGMPLTEWASWQEDQQSGALHPAVSCAVSADDKLNVWRLTSGPDKWKPEAPCAWAITAGTSGTTINSWVAHQRCR